MEKRIYSIGISFIIEVEADSAIEAQDEAVDILRWKMHEHEAKYLQLSVRAAKKIVPPPTVPVPLKETGQFEASAMPEAEVLPDPRLKDDIPF